MGPIERGERTVTLVTADKPVKGLDLTLAGLLLEMEQDGDNSESKRPQTRLLPPVPPALVLAGLTYLGYRG